jgi:hypothetical protein
LRARETASDCARKCSGISPPSFFLLHPDKSTIPPSPFRPHRRCTLLSPHGPRLSSFLCFNAPLTASPRFTPIRPSFLFSRRNNLPKTRPSDVAPSRRKERQPAPYPEPTHYHPIEPTTRTPPPESDYEKKSTAVDTLVKRILDPLRGEGKTQSSA